MGTREHEPKAILVLYGSEKHGAKRPAVQREFYQWVEGVATAFGLPLTNFSCAMVEPKARFRKHKCYTLKRNRSAFAREVENGTVSQFSLYSLADTRDSPAFDWTLTATLGQEDEQLAMCSLGIQLPQFGDCRFGGTVGLTNMIQDLLRLLRGYVAVDYGFAVAMPRDFCASGYIIGLASGEAPPELRYDANLWAKGHRKNCAEALRNLYGCNVVTKRHLSIDVGGRTLAEWIAESDTRGRVEPLVDERGLWTFAACGPFPEYLHWDSLPVVEARRSLSCYYGFSWADISAHGS